MGRPMSATMTIKITEDDAPDGHVSVDFDVEGFDIEAVKEDGELPPAVLLGAQMVQLVDTLPSVGGRVPPPSRGHIPSRREH
jgi:hypothetical protein